MPPKNIVTKEQIIQAAADIAGESGADAVTARSVAAKLGISTHPIFSYYKSVDELKTDMYYAAENIYRRYVECGLSQPIPFLGVGQQYIRTCLHKHMRTSFRQILPQTALKILAGRQPACGFLPCLQQNYARKSAHISYEDRF